MLCGASSHLYSNDQNLVDQRTLGGRGGVIICDG